MKQFFCQFSKMKQIVFNCFFSNPLKKSGASKRRAKPGRRKRRIL